MDRAEALWKSLVLAVATIGLSGCVGSDPEVDCSGANAQALLGGFEAATVFGATDPVLSVGALVSVDGNDVARTLTIQCTAIALTPRFVLTAHHCVHDLSLLGNLRFTFATQVPTSCTPDACPQSECAKMYTIRAGRAHPSLDVLVLELDRPAAHSFGRTAREAVRVGDAVAMVGYGLTQSGHSGRRDMLYATVITLGEQQGYFRVQGTQRGACFGDSGGPLFRSDAHGVEVLGILSAGSSTCRDFDDYVDLSRIVSWLEEVTQSR